MKLVTAEIITIGDEILYGQVVDTNSAWMGTELGNIGVKVQQITSISDTKEAIRRALDDARTRANIVLLTGGLGPTKDDLTKATLTEYFNTELVLDEVSLADITLLFQSRGRDLTPLNEQQAYLPANSKPIRNLLGTAPGMWFDVNDVVIVSMPGVPFEMQRMMTDTVLPKLKERFTLPAIIHKVVQTVGIGESALAEIITEWEDNLPPYIKLAYLPHLNGVRLRLTGIAEEDDALEDQMLIQLDKLSDLIPRYIYAYGEVSLEETVGMLLNARSYTIATAESC
ncbi:MAG: damage-inducible protein CinA, partial [Hymenobacteraceae bacterium]|nr:damage-inducible protein CinA [Hymenobacteraceae bacterium]